MSIRSWWQVSPTDAIHRWKSDHQRQIPVDANEGLNVTKFVMPLCTANHVHCRHRLFPHTLLQHSSLCVGPCLGSDVWFNDHTSRIPELVFDYCCLCTPSWIDGSMLSTFLRNIFRCLKSFSSGIPFVSHLFINTPLQFLIHLKRGQHIVAVVDLFPRTALRQHHPHTTDNASLSPTSFLAARVHRPPFSPWTVSRSTKLTSVVVRPLPTTTTTRIVHRMCTLDPSCQFQ